MYKIWMWQKNVFSGWRWRVYRFVFLPITLNCIWLFIFLMRNGRKIKFFCTESYLVMTEFTQITKLLQIVKMTYSGLYTISRHCHNCSMDIITSNWDCPLHRSYQRLKNFNVILVQVLRSINFRIVSNLQWLLVCLFWFSAKLMYIHIFDLFCILSRNHI